MKLIRLIKCCILTSKATARGLCLGTKRRLETSNIGNVFPTARNVASLCVAITIFLATHLSDWWSLRYAPGSCGIVVTKQQTKVVSSKVSSFFASPHLISYQHILVAAKDPITSITYVWKCQRETGVYFNIYVMSQVCTCTRAHVNEYVCGENVREGERQSGRISHIL